MSNINIHSEQHPVFIGSILEELPRFLQKLKGRHLFLISDQKVMETWFSYVKPIFEQFDVHGQYVFPSGEAHKTLQTCQSVWNSMLDARLERNALVINLGGGVVGDLGGFCAATWKRGVDFIHIPTTLLAMTDAALGGKTGVDFQGIKNIIGAIRQPKAVFVDTQFLKTLPQSELKSGLAEVIKHAWIAAPELWETIENAPNLIDLPWDDLLPKSIQVKMDVVAQDVMENGLRKVLNFGHTIGHAIEAYSHQIGRPITHGHAVAMGMAIEFQMAFGEKKPYIALIDFVQKRYEWLEIPTSDYVLLWKLMQNDKKNRGGEVRFVVPTDGRFGMEEHRIKEFTEIPYII